MCSNIIDLEVVIDLDIKDIELITGSFLGSGGLFGSLLLSGLDQLLLSLHLHLNKLTLSAGSIGLLSLLFCEGNLGFLLFLFGLLILVLFFFLLLGFPKEKLGSY